MFIGNTQINFFPTQELLDITENFKEGDLPKLLSVCCVDKRDSYFTEGDQSGLAPFEPEHSTNVELHCILESIIDSTLNVMPVINTGPLNGDGVVYCIPMAVGEYEFVNGILEPIDIIHAYMPKIIVRKNSTAHWFMNALSESNGERYVNMGGTLNFIVNNFAEEIYMSEITKRLLLDESKYDGDTLKFSKKDNLVSDNAFLHDMGLIDEIDEDIIEGDLEFDELHFSIEDFYAEGTVRGAFVEPDCYNIHLITLDGLDSILQTAQLNISDKQAVDFISPVFDDTGKRYGVGPRLHYELLEMKLDPCLTTLIDPEINGITWKEGALLFDNYLASELPCALLITQGKQK